MANPAILGLPPWAGWHLLGSFPPGESDGVGSWLLHHNGEAMLLETPPGLRVATVWSGLVRTGTALKFIATSHDHEDHLDTNVWDDLRDAFPDVRMLHPSSIYRDRCFLLGDEQVYLVGAAKHSLTDTTTIFRGVAMTGDIELGMLDSVNEEVEKGVKRASMDWLRMFPWRTGYRIHTTISAHLNDLRTNVDWESLFTP